MRNLSIGARIAWGYALMVALLCGSIVLTIIEVEKQDKAIDRVLSFRHPVVEDSLLILDGLNHSLAALRGWMLLKEERFLEERAFAWSDEIEVSLSQIIEREREAGEKEMEAKLERTRQKLQNLKSYQQQLEDISKATDISSINENGDSKSSQKTILENAERISLELENDLNELLQEQKRLLDKDLSLEKNLSERFHIMLWWILGSGFALGIFLAFFITRGIVRPLRDLLVVAECLGQKDLTVEIPEANRRDEIGVLMESFREMAEGLREINKQMAAGVLNLSSSSKQLSALTSQIAATAEETATSVNNTATSMEEVRQTVAVAAQKAQSVSEEAETTIDVSRQGEAAVSEMVDGMSRIQRQMETIAESITRLSEQSQAIGDIISTVKDLADQSNLLAVNASIEAAKAGDHGKGFTVVAQEVKSLADQSKQATGQVQSILSDIQKATASAVMAIEEGGKAVEAGMKQSSGAGDSIQALAASIQEAAKAAFQIDVSSKQQLVGVNQVAQAMDDINRASKQSADGLREISVTVQSLEKLGDDLKRLMDLYKL